MLLRGEVRRRRCVFEENLFVEAGLTQQRVGPPALRLLSRVAGPLLEGGQRRTLVAIEIGEGARGPVRLHEGGQTQKLELTWKENRVCALSLDTVARSWGRSLAPESY